jgi:hypothetical protein
MRDRSSDSHDNEESNGGVIASNVVSWAVPQAELPRGSVDLEEEWDRADRAFDSGEYSEAQQSFGLVYLVEPNYRSGQVQSALILTCRYIGNDCTLVMGRLDALRI